MTVQSRRYETSFDKFAAESKGKEAAAAYEAFEECLSNFEEGENIRVRLFDDYVLVTHARRLNTVRGLYVPDTAREDHQQGFVLALGWGERTDSGERLPLTVEIGDRVLWAKHWEKPVDLGRNGQYAFVRERDIIGIVRGDDIEPLYNTVVIEADPLETRHGALWLPMQQKKPMMPAMRGTVVKCGPGHRLPCNGEVIPLLVQPGDRVLFEAYGGEDHEFDKKTLRLIPEEHILGTID